MREVSIPNTTTKIGVLQRSIQRVRDARLNCRELAELEYDTSKINIIFLFEELRRVHRSIKIDVGEEIGAKH